MGPHLRQQHRTARAPFCIQSWRTDAARIAHARLLAAVGVVGVVSGGKTVVRTTTGTIEANEATEEAGRSIATDRHLDIETQTDSTREGKGSIVTDLGAMIAMKARGRNVDSDLPGECPGTTMRLPKPRNHEKRRRKRKTGKKKRQLLPYQLG